MTEELNINEKREIIRHSTAHVMAQAVFDLFPGAKYAIGPAIDNGFYYDFDLGQNENGDNITFEEKDLKKIDKRMRQIIKQNQKFVRKELSFDEGLQLFLEADQPYKVEIIERVKEGAQDQEDSADIAPDSQGITLYENILDNGTIKYYDLCTGPHVESTNKLGFFQLQRVAGAYWRGDEKNKMLQRIYGTAWESQEALDEYLHMLEEAEKRDHRKIGHALNLFTISDQIGKGLILWTPKGNIIREELENWAKETERSWGYDRVDTPHISKSDLFYKSGHLPYYKDDMYSPMDIDGEEYYLKPMNCPLHHEIFNSQKHSYRDLPVRYAEYGTLYRYEKSGELFGLMRVRGFTQNDAHIYCSLDQTVEEFVNIMHLHEYFYKTLGIDKYEVVIGTRDPENLEKYHDDDDMWALAEKLTLEGVEKSGVPYRISEGDAAHYGPKADFNIYSAIGKEFSISTNQVDLYMPKRFNLTFTNSEGEEEFAVVQHRAPLGSHERFVGFLIEHFAGEFPTWLAPVQIVFAPVADRHDDYAYKLAKEWKKQGIRAEVQDASSASLGARIRSSKQQKVPYILVVGDEDVQNETVGINARGSDNPIRDIKAEEFISKVLEEIKSKNLKLSY